MIFTIGSWKDVHGKTSCKFVCSHAMRFFPMGEALFLWKKAPRILLMWRKSILRNRFNYEHVSTRMNWFIFVAAISLFFWIYLIIIGTGKSISQSKDGGEGFFGCISPRGLYIIIAHGYVINFSAISDTE